MRARVRKDDTQITAGKHVPPVPWSVRAAATLPRGARLSNPLFGDEPEGTIAVLDTATHPEPPTAELIADIAKRADGALVVDARRVVPSAEELSKHGFVPFTIDGCDLLFGATYELPRAPWLHKVDVAKGDATISPSDPGHLQPDQKQSKFRRVQTKDGEVLEGDTINLLSKSAHVTKNEDGTEERYVLGIVLEPDEVDSQGDTISAEEIRRAAHRYMEEHGNVGLQHQVFVNGKIKILESYIAPTAFSIGGELVKAGTWLMAFRVLDDSIWKAIKEGLLDGLSIGGSGLKIPVA